MAFFVLLVVALMLARYVCRLVMLLRRWCLCCWDLDRELPYCRLPSGRVGGRWAKMAWGVLKLSSAAYVSEEEAYRGAVGGRLEELRRKIEAMLREAAALRWKGRSLVE